MCQIFDVKNVISFRFWQSLSKCGIWGQISDAWSWKTICKPPSFYPFLQTKERGGYTLCWALRCLLKQGRSTNLLTDFVSNASIAQLVGHEAVWNCKKMGSISMESACTRGSFPCCGFRCLQTSLIQRRAWRLFWFQPWRGWCSRRWVCWPCWPSWHSVGRHSIWSAAQYCRWCRCRSFQR